MPDNNFDTAELAEWLAVDQEVRIALDRFIGRAASATTSMLRLRWTTRTLRLHRDVKRANLLIEQHPRHGMQALLTDFGIARTLADTITLSAIVATFAYTAPRAPRDQPTE